MQSLEPFRDAAASLRNVARDTGLISSRMFSLRTGNKVYFKPENMQLTGAFKIRGALYKISRLSGERRRRGVIAASAGNHAQGVALASELQGIRATIVMPETTPPVKVDNTKSYGAEVVLAGDLYDDACSHAVELAGRHGFEFVHPFDDLDVATGQGTVALEILRALPETDVVLVPVGGGGLIAGVATLAKMLKPEIAVIGVEPTGAASMKRSLEQGRVTSLDHVETIADGVAVRTPGERVFPYVRKNVDAIMTVDDDELIDAFLDMLKEHKMIVENAGLLGVAALNHLEFEGKNVVVILSGGNMDIITVSSFVRHGLRRRGRIVSFKVRLPGRPEEPHRITGVLAAAKATVLDIHLDPLSSINRHAGADVVFTLETLGHSHIAEIVRALGDEGYDAEIL